MKLHLALYHFEDVHQAKSLLQQVVDLVDIVEVGTLMIMQEGETGRESIQPMASCLNSVCQSC